MNPPTKESTVLRFLSNALMGIGSDVGRLRWALHPHLTPDAIEILERLQKELISHGIGAENEAGTREYQATLAQPVDPAPPSPSPPEEKP